MAKQETRRADGRPENPADRKFFDLRESGWDGPVDQDGNAVAEGREAEVLRDMRNRAR